MRIGALRGLNAWGGKQGIEPWPPARRRRGARAALRMRHAGSGDDHGKRGEDKEGAVQHHAEAPTRSLLACSGAGVRHGTRRKRSLRRRGRGAAPALRRSQELDPRRGEVDSGDGEPNPSPGEADGGTAKGGSGSE